MKKLILVVLTILALAAPALALQETLDVSGMTEKQIAELKVQAAQVKETNRVQVPSVDKANQWVEVGKNAGLALASCAKEVGVAGDAFLNSFTGKVVFGVLIFKMMGGAIIHIIGACIIIIVGIPFWFWLWKCKFINKDTYNEAGKRISRVYYQIDGEQILGCSLSFAIIVGAALLALFTF
jgi:hypothetical protein